MFHLSVLTLREEIFRGDVDSLTVPGVEGELGVLTHHVPFITALKAGEMRIKGKESEQRMQIARGFLEVRPDEVVLLIEQKK